MYWILLTDSSLSTEDCRSHLLMQMMNGIRMLLVSTPSGRGRSSSGFYSSLILKFLLTINLNVLDFAILIELGLLVLLVEVGNWVTKILLDSLISSSSTMLNPALFCRSYRNLIQLSRSSMKDQGLVKSSIITTTAFFKSSAFWSCVNTSGLYRSSTKYTSSFECVPT